MIQHETGDPELTFYNVIYTKPYCRIQPYLIGLVLGYILHYQIKPGGPGKWVSEKPYNGEQLLEEIIHVFCLQVKILLSY